MYFGRQMLCSASFPTHRTLWRLCVVYSIPYLWLLAAHVGSTNTTFSFFPFIVGLSGHTMSRGKDPDECSVVVRQDAKAKTIKDPQAYVSDCAHSTSPDSPPYASVFGG